MIPVQEDSSFLQRAAELEARQGRVKEVEIIYMNMAMHRELQVSI